MRPARTGICRSYVPHFDVVITAEATLHWSYVIDLCATSRGKKLKFIRSNPLSIEPVVQLLTQVSWPSASTMDGTETDPAKELQICKYRTRTAIRANTRTFRERMLQE